MTNPRAPQVFRAFFGLVRVTVIGLLTSACLDQTAGPPHELVVPTAGAGDVVEPAGVPIATRGFVRLTIDLAPGQGVGDFCVDVVVSEASGSALWSRTALCSHQFGAAGGLTYIGFCTTDRGRANRVLVTLVSVVDGDLRPLDVPLPCGDGARCDMAFDCVGGESTSVEIAPE